MTSHIRSSCRLDMRVERKISSRDACLLNNEGQEILRRSGIDPFFGAENLVWEPYKYGVTMIIDPTRKNVGRKRIF